MPATEMSPHGLLIAPARVQLARARVQLARVRSLGVPMATTSMTPTDSAISRSMHIYSFRDRPTRFGIWGSGRIQAGVFLPTYKRLVPSHPCAFFRPASQTASPISRRASIGMASVGWPDAELDSRPPLYMAPVVHFPTPMGANLVDANQQISRVEALISSLRKQVTTGSLRVGLQGN